MEKRSLPPRAMIFLLIALVFLSSGLMGGINALHTLETGLLSGPTSGTEREMIRTAVVQFAVCAFAVSLGICMFFSQGLTLRKENKEERRLKEKNEKMEKLLQQTQELAHHQRLETIGTLTASIAHEFNNLLTPIMGYSMMALEKIPEEDEELYDGLVEIYETSRKAKNIISRLSDLARKNSGEVMRPISIDDLVKKTLDVAAPAKPTDVQIKLDLNCWDQRFEGNEIQINQLLLNLILNSFHAMELSEGTLTIHTSFDEEKIQIRITDTGCGIPEEIRERIFEPFFTTKEAGKGTGLGLAIAAQVVEEHHGSIEVKSEAMKGTTMTISLPKAGEQK